ncbi:MAG: hypothetical protein IJ808_00430 [Muribaculaceae bacterium]|nr:hypothetical protein [Muribaculaceae bacterium]
MNRKTFFILLLAMTLCQTAFAAGNNVTGRYVASYLDSYKATRSTWVTIAPDTLENSDSLLIYNLTGYERCIVKAMYDAEKNLLTIPVGQSFVHLQDNKTYQVCPIKSETWSDYDLEAPVTFTVTDDSALILNHGGIAKVNSENSNMSPVLHFDLYKPHTKMVTPIAKGAKDLSSDSTSIVDVRVLQTSDSTLRIVGVDNAYCYIDLDYDSEGNFTIRHQNAQYMMSMYPEVYAAKAHLDYETNTYTLGNIDDPNDLATGKLTPRLITIEPWSFVRRQKIGSINRQMIANSYKLGSTIEVPFNIALPVRAPHEPDLTLSGGSGTAEDPYKISNLADFKELAQACNLDPVEQFSETDSLLVGHYRNKYFVLTNDIDMTDTVTFKPIAANGTNTAYSFGGNLNGNGYKISNLKVEQTTNYAGLFGRLDTATVTNIVLDNSCSVSGAQQVGGIAGYARISTVTGITSSAAIISSTGVVGSILGAVQNCVIDDCHMLKDGSVTSARHAAGGISGYVNTYGTVISNCTVAGTIAANGTNGAGGISGYMYGRDGNPQNKIVDCRVLSGASITGTTGSTGGILGYALGTRSSSSAPAMRNTICIERCVTEAGVTVSAPSMQVGGIVGSMAYSRVEDCVSSAKVSGTLSAGGIVGNGEQTDVVRCVTTAEAEIEATVGTTGGAGGIMGATKSYVDIDSCYSAATVKSANMYAGGIVGNIGLSYVNIKNCNSTGRVEGLNQVGGITGKMSNSSVIENCYSTCDVEATGTADAQAGGIAGRLMSNCEVRNSFFAGTVKSNGLYCGGIAAKLEGYYSANTGKYTQGCLVYNSYNVGSVSGAGYVGGVVGHASYSSKVFNTYNQAPVTVIDYAGEAQLPADVQGANVIAYVDTTVTLADNYHLASLPALSGDTLSTAISSEQLASADIIESLGIDYIHAEASFPLLKSFSDLPLAQYHAAFFLPEPKEGQEVTFTEQGTHEFTTNATLALANFDDVEWAATGALMIVDGKAVPAESGEAILTATLREPATGNTGDAMKAPATGNLSKTYKINVDTTTGISTVTAADVINANGPRFNLKGQRVGNDAQGIIIVNGRKVLVK